MHLGLRESVRMLAAHKVDHVYLKRVYSFGLPRLAQSVLQLMHGGTRRA